MPLTGQAKKDYQRKYMRKHRSNKRSNKRSNVTPESVRPSRLDRLAPKLDRFLDKFGNASLPSPPCKSIGPIETAEAIGLTKDKPEPQSYNPMMVGYVPPPD